MAKKYSGTGRSIFHITCPVSIQVTVPEDSDMHETARKVDGAVRTAWTQLRRRYPCLASRVIWNKELSYWAKICTMPGDEIEGHQWLNSTFRQIQEDTTGAGWRNNDPPAPKLPMLFVESFGRAVSTNNQTRLGLESTA
jgi:hypothetical protein